MPSVVCPNSECIYNKNNKCQSKKIALSFWNVATVNEGRRDFWVCKQYEMSTESKELEDRFKKFLESRGNG